MGFPPGHYHSPIPAQADLLRDAARLWAPKPGLAAVDMRVPQQLALLETLRPHVAAIDWPIDAPSRAPGYFYGNGMFPVLDAEFLFAAMCEFRPRRVVEVGSGFSSLVLAEANRRVLAGACAIACIEPCPRDFLTAGVEGIGRLIPSRMEDVDLGVFDALDAGDLLFIDSSHVAKAGSDVNFLFFEVLPRLRPGVYVHLHDVFLPDEYPRAWLVDEERSWNEQYLLHAFLMFNPSWRVVWMAQYMATRHEAAVNAVFPRFPSLGGGGSFWMQRC